jgi:biotin-dependent carboxylase-like uncharacterized protein
MSSALSIMGVAGLATIQDGGGRPGYMHEGVPTGGALVPELLARANVAVGNAPHAAGIEIVGSLTVATRGAELAIAADDGARHVLRAGDSRRVESRRGLRVVYLAVRGGIDVPAVLGSRATLLAAGLGGLGGRALRGGDLLPISAAPGSLPGTLRDDRRASIEDDGPLRVVAGPDHERFAPDALRLLVESAFTISPSSDRTGTRLVGPPVPRADTDADAPSAPMVAGAIEVPASGSPIVLGPDHPTTGGYPVLAVLVRADLGRFHARPIGAAVRFVRVGV